MSISRLLGRLFGGQEAAPANSRASAAPPAAPPPKAFNYDDERIPGSARQKALKILQSIEAVEKAMVREDVPSFSRVDTAQMRNVHLPQLIQSYIDVPTAHRDEIFKRTGKSASFHLSASLDKLQKRVDTMLRDLAEHDIAAFTNNTRFIDERYSNDDNPFR
jgi:hypothetical protein